MKRVVVLPLLVAGALGASCSSSGSGSASSTLTVYAASSLTGTFTEIGKDFEAAHQGVRVQFSFGSSGDLATQIVQGAPTDVFASAAPKNMQAVIDAGDAKSSVDFAANEAEIAVPPSNPKAITSLEDLANPGVRVAICVPTAPCGALATSILDKAGVSVTPTATPPDVKSTLAVVESGEIDAGIVYVTDVAAAGDKVEGVKIPDAQNQTTEYPIAALKAASDSDVAKAFIDYVTSTAGQDVLAKAGFLKP